jgi:cytochrome c553
MHAAISRNTHFAAQIRWGVVPVEDDGSAQFTVPANRSIFFAALDKDYRLIQQERTFVNYKPGERRACIGCHETPKDVPPVAGFPKAFQRAPSEPGPQAGETTGKVVLDYEHTVQPILDKNCTSCHGATKKNGNLDLSSTPTTLFNTSYEALMDRRGWLLGLNIDEEPRNPPETSKYLPAYSLYGNNAVLLKMFGVPVTLTGTFANQATKAATLATAHASIKLTTSELQTISEFIDTNLQYYGHYWGRRNTKYSTHANFRPKVTFEQAIGTVNPSSNP